MIPQAEKQKYIQDVDYELIIHPKITVSKEIFVRDYPAYSIALDGYVTAPTFVDAEKPQANIDHHEDCNRLATRSTTGQIVMFIRQKVISMFMDDSGKIIYKIFVNDADEDDGFAVKMLKDPHIVLDDPKRRFEQLADLNDKMDATCGNYRVPLNDPLLQALTWIGDPYREFRYSGGLDRNDPGEYRAIIEEIGQRIERYVKGTHRLLSPDTRYQKMGGGNGWIMISETAKHSRMGAVADGYDVILTVRQLQSGNFSYVFTKMSSAIPVINLPYLKAVLNKLEGGTDNAWGGNAQTILGSPRMTGSKISPAAMEKIVNLTIKASLLDRQRTAQGGIPDITPDSQKILENIDLQISG